MFNTSLLSGAITGFIFGTFAAVPASAAPNAEPILRAEGPIVRNPVTNRIAVVGTEFAFANNVRVIVNGVATGEGPAAITTLRLDGQEIVRAYSTDPRGPLTAITVNTAVAYVPGASTVLLHAEVKSVDSATGHATVGQTLVDYTPALANAPELHLMPGDLVTVIGKRAGDRSPILADAIQTTTAEIATAGARVATDTTPAPLAKVGISGSGRVGISGSGATGKVGISGSGAAGKVGISGSGATDTLASLASAKATASPGRVGISGSGATGKVGISGSGASATPIANASVAVSRVGISGSGATTDSTPKAAATSKRVGISGSGAAGKVGISGSGATAGKVGISGSGATATLAASVATKASVSAGRVGISGSGIIGKVGISGSGATSKVGISGSGATAKAVAQSGRVGISGSGASGKIGISGSGATASIVEGQFAK